MTRFYGEVGYGDTVEDPPNSSIWKEQITEYSYFGEVLQNNRRLEEGDGLNHDIVVGNRISIVADDHASKNYLKIKYIRWEGECWTVTNVEVRRPRLILSLGSVWNGPKA